MCIPLTTTTLQMYIYLPWWTDRSHCETSEAGKMSNLSITTQSKPYIQVLFTIGSYWWEQPLGGKQWM
jgi:hypothetical protein